MELVIDSQLGFANLTEYERMLEESDAEKFFYGIPLKRKAERTVIIVGESVVGFFEHGMSTFNGQRYYRTNRPYTAVIHRGHGYMVNALKMWYQERRPGMCWIDDENISSIRLFHNVGFRKVEAFFHEGKHGCFYRLS